jgi:hypothetical protein
MNTDYLTDLVKKYFPPVFFLWVICNILLRLFVTKRKRKKRKKRKKGKRGGFILDTFKIFICFLIDLFTFGLATTTWCRDDEMWGRFEEDWNINLDMGDQGNG